MFDTLKRFDKIWSIIQHHWKTYPQKFHVVVGKECHTQEDKSVNEDCRDDVDDNDDDCIVSLPSESNSNGNNSIESGSDDDGYCYSNKRKSVKRGKY